MFKSRVRSFAFLLLAGLATLPQTLLQRTFLLRAEITSFDPYAGMSHVCVRVYPDGKYRREKSFQGNQGGEPDNRVYLEQLSEESRKQIHATVDDSGFQNIKTPDPDGGIVKDVDLLSVLVPREHGVQNINFETANQRKPYGEKFEAAVQLDEGRTATQGAGRERGAFSNNCQAPQVMYQGSLQPEPPTAEDH